MAGTKVGTAVPGTGRRGGRRPDRWLAAGLTLVLAAGSIAAVDATPRTVLGGVVDRLADPLAPVDDLTASVGDLVDEVVPETVGAVVDGLTASVGRPLDDALASAGLVSTGQVAAPAPFSALALELPEEVDEVWVRTVGPLGVDDWTSLDVVDLEDGPDLDTAEAADAAVGTFTDLAWVGVGTALEVVVPTGTPLDEVTVHLTDTLGLGDGLLEEVEAEVDRLLGQVDRTLADPLGAVEALLTDTVGQVTDLADGGADVAELDPISALLDQLLGSPEPSPSPPPSTSPSQPSQRHWTDGFRASTARPAVTRRRDWGANEAWRRGSASVRTPRFAVVHHTATSNGYSKAEAPAVVRAIYRHHTQTMGWSDIGYNLLIDRYGRTYEGRAGGIERGVVGAHARGYNSGSFGVALIGNFEQASTTRSALRSLTNVVAWKYRVHGIDPGASRTVTHDGRRIATLVGHRDVGSTACPGRHVTKHQPEVRRQVARARG